MRALVSTHKLKVTRTSRLTVACYAGRLEESFLMVPVTASAMRQGTSQNLQASTPGYSLENVDEKFQQLARIFEIASGETRVMHGHDYLWQFYSGHLQQAFTAQHC